MQISPITTASPFTTRWIIVLAFVAALGVALLAAGINPVGYVGAGADDEKYLEAARCWVATSGPCLPDSHWWTRWPVFAPIAGFTALLGESRWSVGLAPSLYWLAALMLTGWLGTLWFGWRAGAIAVAMLGATPVVAAMAFDPNVDLPELAFQAAGLVAATYAYRRASRPLALMTGVLAALALQARDTSAIMLTISAGIWLLLDTKRRLVLLWAAPGFLATIGAEMLIYALTTGDPLMRYRLALGHTNIPSFELPSGFKSNRGPLLNPDYVRAWKRDAGFMLWWPIDPWLNLLLSARSATLIGGTILSLAFFWKRISPLHRVYAVRLLGAASVVALLLVYVLAVDPKPRMFITLWAAFAIASGAALATGLNSVAWPLALTVIGLQAALGLQVMRSYPASAKVEARASQWIQAYGQDIELDKGASSYLTLLPQARALAKRGAGRRYLVAMSAIECEGLIGFDRRTGPNGRVVDHISGTNPQQGSICLFEYLPVRASVLQNESGTKGVNSLSN